MKIYVLDECTSNEMNAIKIGLKYLDAIESRGDPLFSEYSGRDIVRVFSFNRDTYYLKSGVKDLKDAQSKIYIIVGSPYRGLVLVEEYENCFEVLCCPYRRYTLFCAVVPKREPELFIEDAIDEYSLIYHRYAHEGNYYIYYKGISAISIKIRIPLTYIDIQFNEKCKIDILKIEKELLELCEEWHAFNVAFSSKSFCAATITGIAPFFVKKIIEVIEAKFDLEKRCSKVWSNREFQLFSTDQVKYFMVGKIFG